MKKFLLFLLINIFAFGANAQITLSGSNLFFSVPRLYSCSDIIGTISFNGTYILDGTANGKNQYSMSVSNPNQDGIVCFGNNNNGIGLNGSKIYIRWNATALNWNIGFIGQIGPNTFTFFTLATLSGDTSDPPCGPAFGGTISGASCIQNCTNSMTVTGSTTICAGASATLTATGCNGTVSWDNNGGTGSSISVSPTSTTTYIATCSTAGVCAGSATVTVNSPPTPEIVIGGNFAFTTNASICSGDAIYLYCGGCTAIENSSINWSNGTTSTGTVNLSASFVPLTSTTYYATRTVNGCTSPSSNIVSVTVNPIIQVTATNSTICSGTSTTLTATGCSGGTITWDNNGGTGTTITVSPSSTTTYNATCSIAGICGASVMITVNNTPNAPVVNSTNTSYCAGTTATLSSSCTSGSILWNTGATTFQITTTTNGIFSATCSSGSCTSPQSNAFPISFHSTPTISGNNCVGSQLTATGFGTAPIQWLKDGIELTGVTTANFTPSQAGTYQLVTTSQKGAWTVMTPPTNLPLSGVYFVDAAQGWIVGSSGIIYKTINGGTTWTQQTSGINTSLNAVFFTNSNNGVAVGHNGVILRTTNGGTTWTNITSGTTNTLYDVYFLDANNGWAVGSQYAVLKTTNGGASWVITSVDNAASTSDYYAEVQFTDSNTGYAVGGNSSFTEGLVRKSTDGGSTWNTSFSQTNNSFIFGLSFPNANTGWIGGAIAGSASYAQKTTNAGSNWSNVSFAGLNAFDPIRAIQFIDANRGWFITSNSFMGNAIFSTRDGGTSFTRESITNASQISSIATSRDIFMLPDGNSGWIVGYNPSFGNSFLMKFSNKVCFSNTITINGTPTVPTLNLSGTQILCPNTTITLTASGCSGTINWTNGSTGSSISTSAAGTYTATCTTACGTSQASTPVIITSVPASLTLSGAATNGTQQASQNIVSTQTIGSSTNTAYRAGNSVTLNPSFTTQIGAVFKAEIGGCE